MQTTLPLLREEAMAERIGISKRTLRAWRDLGLVPFIKVKRLILFNEREVLKTLEKFKREAR
jgi:DNA-binding transcriptional MerR regulator